VARLLILEEDGGIRVPLARALEREGYVVDGAGDGEPVPIPFRTAQDAELDIVDGLRRKLGEDAAEPRHLVTVRGVGLRFEP
jgi:DNA-binding response OmpR family regulator